MRSVFSLLLLAYAIGTGAPGMAAENPPPYDLQKELHRTLPDFIVHVPTWRQGPLGDTGNEHLLVFDGPDGSLMAVWTQSTFEGTQDQHIAFSRSDDEGKSWTTPRTVAGPDPNTGTNMASWGFPMVSRSGRIYLLFNRHTGVNDLWPPLTGTMGGCYSDDNGKTWSTVEDVPMARNQYDNPDASFPTNWIIWQKPERLSEGKYFAGFTHWFSAAVSKTPKDEQDWTQGEGATEFMRFENIDDNPEVRNIIVSRFANGKEALTYPSAKHPELCVIQEPSIVKLPDGRLFCIMRTSAGHPAWSVSINEGKNWSRPQPLRQRTGGPIFANPLAPSPIYPLSDGTFLFLFHNSTDPRRDPLYRCRGTFTPEMEQPVSFSDPALFMDVEPIDVGPGMKRGDLSMYASITHRNGKNVLWYPDRKHFLLGRIIRF